MVKGLYNCALFCIFAFIKMKETFYKSSGDLEHNGLQKEWSIIRKFDQQIADSISKEGRKNTKRLSASNVAKVIEVYKNVLI